MLLKVMLALHTSKIEKGHSIIYVLIFTHYFVYFKKILLYYYRLIYTGGEGIIFWVACVSFLPSFLPTFYNQQMN